MVSNQLYTTHYVLSLLLGNMIAFLSGHYIEVQIDCYIEHCSVQSSILLNTLNAHCMMYITISDYQVILLRVHTEHTAPRHWVHH